MCSNTCTTYYMYIKITQKREGHTVCNHQKNYCVYIILIAKPAIYFVSILRELLLFTIGDSNLYVYTLFLHR